VSAPARPGDRDGIRIGKGRCERAALAATCVRSFGFEFQEPWSAFTSGRARKRYPKTFSLAAHNQELVLGHVTFVLHQLFQISLERGLCLNHCIERLLDLGRQIVCVDVLPLQFFPCHCLAPNLAELTKPKASVNWPSSLERDEFLWCHDLSVYNTSVKGTAFDGIVVVARSDLRRLASKNSDVSSAVAIEILHPPCALKFEIGQQARLRGSSG